MNLLDNVEILDVANETPAGQTAINGAGVDCHDCEGVLFLVPIDAVVTNGVVTATAEQSDDNGSSDDFDALAGAQAVATDTAEGFVALDVRRPRKRYVRCAVARTVADSTIGRITAVKYGLRKTPRTQAVGAVIASASVNEAAEA